MNRVAKFRLGLCVAIVSAICQTVLAETMPGHPDYSWLFDEGSGTKAAAHSGGHDHDGTLATDATWSTDTPFQYAGNHSVCVTNGEVSASGFALGAAGTISMWVECTSYGRFQYLLDSESDRTLEYLNLDIGVSGDDRQEVTWINNGLAGNGSDWANSTTFPLNRWHHVAIVWNNAAATKVQIYYDATPVTNSTIAVNPSSQPTTWYFGKRFMTDSGGSWERWQGQIDEYAFWNKRSRPTRLRGSRAIALANCPNQVPCSWRQLA